MQRRHEPATVVLGHHDQPTLDQLAAVARGAERVALLPDGHLGYVMPIGGVAAYLDRLSVVGVGFDIGCGNMAARTPLRADAFDRRDLGALADAVFDELSFGVGLKNVSADAPTDHPLFDDDAFARDHGGMRPWRALAEVGAPTETLRAKAREQLGTVGGGNHYVDILADEAGWLWVGVHFGSRGLGHQVATGFMALAQGSRWGQRVPEREALLDAEGEIGRAYWQAMTLAGAYAAAGRAWVIGRVLRLLDTTPVDTVHNHHNFTWREEHDGETYYVVRKGATPAWPGQRGFVGGSMGDDAVVLRGASGLAGDAAALQRGLLYSTVHGAGRVMSRTKAKGKRRRGQVIEPGAITAGGMHAWLERRGVILRGADVDEAPQAYRRLDEVLADCGPTIEIEHRLRPLVVCMAPGDTVDPYRD
jgi:tRNA-splicing ligase RtcB (3'-phosphate/5'-hydroxy nucleic acid ligase)